jgi:hypothetical protein
MESRRHAVKLPFVATVALALACLAPSAGARPPEPTDAAPVVRSLGEMLPDRPWPAAPGVAKTAVDTFTLLGPGGAWPWRGDFEDAAALPAGNGALAGGWTSQDRTALANHWHVDTYANPGSGNGAWCGAAYPACDGSDTEGGYGNGWHDVLEFRQTVAGPATVRVQATLRFDTEPGYDYVKLQRRTAAAPDLEPVSSGQGLVWDDRGTATVDYTFSYSATELLDGSQVAVAFVVDSDGAWSDEDCEFPTAGAAILDDVVVTVSDGATRVWTEDFEDGSVAPEWSAVVAPGVGDYARVWQGLCDEDPCLDNPTNQVAFLDNDPATWVVPPPPDGCGMVNNTGGQLGPEHHLDNVIISPVLTLPGGELDGLLLSLDVYQHELLVPGDSPGMLWSWAVRSAADVASLELAPWRDHHLYYLGGPEYRRAQFLAGDLLAPGATCVQVQLQVSELGWEYGFGDGTNGTPAPYFDNVRVQVYRRLGPQITIDERDLPNDGFPAAGLVDLQHPAVNSVRFDMAQNVAPWWHARNDPGDSVCIDVLPRGGATTGQVVMHWALARRNPRFDGCRVAVPEPVMGTRARNLGSPIVPNRWAFDLPDTGLLFPGDVLHYYFAATDNLGGDVRQSTLPADLSGFGADVDGAWPELFTVHCLPSVGANTTEHPSVLFWYDQELDGDQDLWSAAWHSACPTYRESCDFFTTRAPSRGAGNGLGGRATLAQLQGYTTIVYTSGDLGSPTLSNGDSRHDPGNDLALLDSWLALGGRNLLAAGDDLAGSLAASGSAGSTFLSDRLRVRYVDADVRDDLGGQVVPAVLPEPGNPVFEPLTTWFADGGCPKLEDFDHIEARGGAVNLARFAAAGSPPAPSTCSAAVLAAAGTNRVITLAADLARLVGGGGQDTGQARAQLLAAVLDYFDAPCSAGAVAPGLPAATAALAVSAQPNPFNPAVTMRYTLPAPGHVTMKVFDTRGRLVRVLLDQDMKTTTGAMTWDGADDRGAPASSGLYFVETRAGGQVDVRKVTMLK